MTTAYTAVLPELRRLRRENKALRAALVAVIPYAKTETSQLWENVENGEPDWEREAKRASKALAQADRALAHTSEAKP